MSLSVAMVAMPRRTGWVFLKVFAIMGASMAPMMGLLMNLVKLKPSYGASLMAPPMATSKPLTAPIAASLSIANVLRGCERLSFTMYEEVYPGEVDPGYVGGDRTKRCYEHVTNTQEV